MTTRFPVILAGFCLGAPAATAQDLDFTLINTTSVAIVEFYAILSDIDVLGEDAELGEYYEDNLLSGMALRSRYETTFVVYSGGYYCIYDFFFAFSDGSRFTDTVDICDRADYTLYD